MNKVYFKIEGKKLYLDYMLEIYDNIPMFYVCKINDNERYLVLCSDFDNESYLIIKVSLEDLSNMLNGKTDIRSTFLDQKEFWNVKCNQSGYSHDKITKNNIDCFPSEYLPKKGEYYVLYDKEHSNYATKINNELEKYGHRTWRS